MTGAGVEHIHEVLDNRLRALAGYGGDLVAHANRIGGTLFAPPRVVIVGRLKAGKSTLVNALIGAPVAETAALEATRLVAVYHDGAPSRAEVVTVDGQHLPVPIIRGQVSQLPVDEEQIAYVNRWLPSAAIRDLTFIDTPGLATLTTRNEVATRRVLIDGFEQTRTASVDADAAVFLFDSAPRADELAFLRELPLSPLNTIGVLSRADGFGEGALGDRDPIAHAASHSTRLAAQLVDTVGSVVPISGLIAQTSHTGALLESDARALASLAGIDPMDLLDMFDTASKFAGPIPPEARRRLLDLVGEYGIVAGRDVAARGAAELNQWLSSRSGVPELHHLMSTSLAEFALLNRAKRVIDSVEQLAFVHPARDQIRGIANEMRSHPAMLRVQLLSDLQRLLVADPDVPLVAELRTLLAGRTPAECLGLPPDASVAHIQGVAAQKRAQTQAQAMSTMTAAEDAAVINASRAYSALATTGRL